MEAAFLGAHTYEGSVYHLWNEGNNMVKACLGPGHFNTVLLSYQIFANVIANVSLAMATSALILMFYGDVPTRVTPSQLASSLLLFAFFALH